MRHMKWSKITFLLLTYTLITFGQGIIKQEGVTYKYNGKYQRTPLGKVYIKVSTSPNGVVSDSISGHFSLQIPNMSMGSRIGNVTVQKRGMMIFNQQAVDEWSIRQEPLRLILCDKNEFEKQKQDLIAIGQREAQKRYDKKISEIEAKYKAESEEWHQKISEADNELQDFQKQIGKYADLFVRIDLSEVSSEEQHILDLVQEGKMDEAVKTYEHLNLIDKLDAEVVSLKSLDNAAQRIEEEKALAKKNIEELYAAINRQLSTLLLAEQSKKAKKLLLSLIDKITPLFEKYPEEIRPWMAKTEYQLGKIEKSPDHYLAALKHYTTLYDSKPNLYIENLANTQFELSNLNKPNDYENIQWVKEHLIPAIKLYQQLYKDEPDKYRQTLAQAWWTLGDCYNHHYIGNDYSMAKEYYLKSINLYTDLAVQQPEKHGLDLAEKYVTLGIFYKIIMHDDSKAKDSEAKAVENYFTALECSTNKLLQDPECDTEEWNSLMLIPSHDNYSDSWSIIRKLLDDKRIEDFFLKTLDLMIQKEEKNSENYGKHLFMTLYYIELYYGSRDHEKEEMYIIQAEELSSRLFNINPKKFQWCFENAQERLRDYFNERKNGFLKVEESHYKELKAYTSLFKQNPAEYAKYVTKKLSNLAHFYVIHDNYSKAEEFLFKNIEFCTSLFNQNPLQYGEYLASAQRHVAEYYNWPQKDKSKEEDYYLKEIDTWATLFHYAPIEKGESFAGRLEQMGDFYRYRDNYLKADEFYQKELETYTLLYNMDSEKWTNVLAGAFFRLGRFYENWYRDYGRAEICYLKELDLVTSLYNQAPQEYGSLLAFYQGTIAKFYQETIHDYSKAEKYYLKELDYYSSLFDQNPSKYSYGYKEKLNALRNFCQEVKHDNAKTEECLLKLEDVYITLSSQDKNYLYNLASTHEELGDFYYDIKDYAKAEASYLQAKKFYANKFEENHENDKGREYNRSLLAYIQYKLMFVYGKNNSRAEQYDAILAEALANFEVLYQKDKSFESIIVNLRNRQGWRYLAKGETDEAMKLFESSYQIDPKISATYLADGYNSKAYQYAKNKKYDKAIEAIDQAISLQPNDANYYDSKGEILLMNGNQQGALEMWQKVMELDSDFLSKHHGTTELYRQLKERKLVE